MKAKRSPLLSQILSKPLFVGLDKKKTLQNICAQGHKTKRNQDEFNLENPKGEIETDSEKFFMKGNFGVYNSKSQILRVEGNVNLTNKRSIEFLTSEAFFDFRKEILFRDQNVTGKKDGSIITPKVLKF